MKNIFHYIFLSLVCTSLSASRSFIGDLSNITNGAGFSFDILHKIGKNRNQEHIWLLAADDLSNAPDSIKTFNICATTSNGSRFVPIATTTATVNGVANKPNPLYSGGKRDNGEDYIGTFCNLQMAGSTPVLFEDISATTPFVMYVITSTPTSPTPSIIRFEGPVASNGDAGTFMTFNQSGLQDIVQGVGNLIISVVGQQTRVQGFGNNGSGIALFRRTATEIIQQKVDNAVRALSLTVASDVLKINSTLANLETDKINLYWSDELSRLYIGVQATSGDGLNDGCKSIAVGYIQDNGTNAALTLYSITSDATISETAKIIGATGLNSKSFVYKQKVMKTTTGLCYLIVVGDSEDPTNDNRVQKYCYALPLVDESADPAKAHTWKTSQTHGTIATKNVSPISYYKTTEDGISVLQARGFQYPASIADDLYDINDPEITVGRESVAQLNAGIIQEIEIYNDTVFALLGGSDERSQVVYSQAIFDTRGVIVNWTQWQCCTYPSTGQGVVKDIIYTPSSTRMLQLETTTGDNIANSFVSYEWSQGKQDGKLGGTTSDASVGLVSLIQEEFPTQEGGVLGLFDFSPQFSKTFFTYSTGNINEPEYIGPYTSMMIATGYKKIALILTYSQQMIGEGATRGDFKNNTLHYTNGEIALNITADSDNVAAIISGGDLDEIGAITSATIIASLSNIEGNPVGNNYNYIVVGGTGGLAVLRETNFHGFDAALGRGFNGLNGNTSTLRFQKFSDIHNIQKVWTVARTETTGGNQETIQYLFVLTNDALYRINSCDLEDENPTLTLIASVNNIAPLLDTSSLFFTDVIASDKLAIVATNHGMLRNGNDTDICTEANEADCNWSALKHYEKYTFISHFEPLLTSSLPYEFATQGAGQVYALAHSDNLQTSILYRIAVKDITEGLENSSVDIVPQKLFQNTSSPFITFRSLRTAIGINGASYLSGTSMPVFTRARISDISSKYFKNGLEQTNAQEITSSFDTNDSIIRGIVRNSASGAWIAYGSFGIRVYE